MRRVLNLNKTSATWDLDRLNKYAKRQMKQFCERQSQLYRWWLVNYEQPDIDS